MAARYKERDTVEFINTRQTDDYGYELPVTERYTEGKQGIVVAVEKVSTAETLDQISEGGHYEYQYTVRVGLTEIQKVPESDITNRFEGIETLVEKRLREKQEKKEFKDTEGRIGGSRKEMAAFRKISGEMFKLSDLAKMEEDSVTAFELIKKDKVYPKVDPSAERSNGVSSGAAFLKVKLRESFGTKPPNNAEKRKIFVAMAEYLSGAMSSVITIEHFEKEIKKFKDSAYYIIVNTIDPEAEEKIRAEVERDEKFQESIRARHAENSRRLGEDKENYTYDDYRRVNEEINRDNSAHLSNSLTVMKSYNGLLGIERSGQRASSLMDYAAWSIIEDVIGSRFVAFVNKKSKAHAGTYQKAEDYNGLSKAESLMLIEKQAKKHLKETVDKYTALLEESKNVLSFEDYQRFFGPKSGNGGFGFKGGNFAQFGSHRGWWYFDDLKTIPQFEAYMERWKDAARERVNKYTGKVKAIEEKYKAREDDWSWAFSSGDGESEKKKRSPITANVYPPLHYIVRKGGIKILDEDITAEYIRKRFGFKEVEFGQSLKDDEAKEHVRHFLGAMADISNILNMDVVEINQLGGLSIAFASRGKGKANAHYEPSRKIINVTKLRGGGSIAHEYMHYIDNVLPSTGKFVSDSSASNYAIKIAVDHIFGYIYRKELPDYLKEKAGIEDETDAEIKIEVTGNEKSYFIPTGFGSGSETVTPTNIDDYWEHFKNRYPSFKYYERISQKDRGIMATIMHQFGVQSYVFKMKTRKSRYFQRSSEVGSPYWTKPWELFARAFETFIWDKLDKAGRANNYLVSGVYFDHPSSVYPSGDERKMLFELFDVLMKTIKKEHNISDFKPWNDETVDEYISLTGDEDEEVVSGVIVDENTGELIDKVKSTAGLKEKLRTLIDLLKAEKMARGGLLVWDDVK